MSRTIKKVKLRGVKKTLPKNQGSYATDVAISKKREKLKNG